MARVKDGPKRVGNCIVFGEGSERTCTDASCKACRKFERARSEWIYETERRRRFRKEFLDFWRFIGIGMFRIVLIGGISSGLGFGSSKIAALFGASSGMQALTGIGVGVAALVLLLSLVTAHLYSK